MQNQNKVKK